MTMKPTRNKQQANDTEVSTLPEPLQTAIIEATYLREQLDIKEAEVLAYMKDNPKD